MEGQTSRCLLNGNILVCCDGQPVSHEIAIFDFLTLSYVLDIGQRTIDTTLDNGITLEYTLFEIVV